MKDFNPGRNRLEMSFASIIYVLRTRSKRIVLIIMQDDLCSFGFRRGLREETQRERERYQERERVRERQGTSERFLGRQLRVLTGRWSSLSYAKTYIELIRFILKFHFSFALTMAAFLMVAIFIVLVVAAHTHTHTSCKFGQWHKPLWRFLPPFCLTLSLLSAFLLFCPT